MARFSALKIYVLASILSTVHAVDVSVPLLAGPSTPKVSGSLISLSIEGDRWTDWTGTTSRNNFFFNTLDNLKQITREPPHIRIGANSEDHTNFRQDTHFAQTVFPPYTPVVPYPEATNITVGDSYYATTRFLPPDTHVTWGVNLGSNNITAAVLETRSIVKAFSSPEIKRAGIVLDYLEMGNEPDLYKNNGLRAKNYTSAQWVDDWLRFARNVSAAAGLSPTSHTKFLGASFAGSSHTTTGFSPQAAFAAGLLTGPGKLISTISQHRYSGSFCAGNGGLLQDLMTKSTIRGNLTIFVPDIQATFAQGLDYILGETNSYACHGAPGVSNTAGAALWALDYALFATQLKISRVFFHVGVGFKYSMIQPVTLTRSTLDGSPLPAPLPPHVQPQYYAAIIAAEAIGKTCNAQVLELSINHPQIAGYAFYEHGFLARAVFINSKAYLPESTNRTSVHLDLNFAAARYKIPPMMTVKRLVIGRATDASGVTWGGQTYETSNGRVGGHLKVEHKPIAQGLDIQETEAVLVSFH
ncbi:putative glycosyl hydrolase family 79 C-terminal beta domain [Lyophyllum shimeji]|uniref:Glycosyl hydrolase family 79 C-terminal beta domain n=1 Tax=Lyophyllum shimeji TaxID=47721 RepID=A0A9P3PSA8_LYOSH|nr:putative glycosyl hydrolase family 79 C-terminal beta domain [Lyophyllum shimeji]